MERRLTKRALSKHVTTSSGRLVEVAEFLISIGGIVKLLMGGGEVKVLSQEALYAPIRQSQLYLICLSYCNPRLEGSRCLLSRAEVPCFWIIDCREIEYSMPWVVLTNSE